MPVVTAIQAVPGVVTVMRESCGSDLGYGFRWKARVRKRYPRSTWRAPLSTRAGDCWNCIRKVMSLEDIFIKLTTAEETPRLPRIDRS